MGKVYDLLGVVSPSALMVAKSEESDIAPVSVLGPGVVGGVAGLTLWKEHRVLGFLLGESVGMNAYRLYRGQGTDRTLAMCNLGSAVAGVAGSLMWKKHPFYGWVVGFVLGSTATAFVPGSNASKLLKK